MAYASVGASGHMSSMNGGGGGGLSVGSGGGGGSMPLSQQHLSQPQQQQYSYTPPSHLATHHTSVPQPPVTSAVHGSFSQQQQPSTHGPGYSAGALGGGSAIAAGINSSDAMLHHPYGHAAGSMRPSADVGSTGGGGSTLASAGRRSEAAVSHTGGGGVGSAAIGTKSVGEWIARLKTLAPVNSLAKILIQWIIAAQAAGKHYIGDFDTAGRGGGAGGGDGSGDGSDMDASCHRLASEWSKEIASHYSSRQMLKEAIEKTARQIEQDEHMPPLFINMAVGRSRSGGGRSSSGGGPSTSPEWKEWKSYASPVFFGREDNLCQLLVSDDEISRRHLVFILVPWLGHRGTPLLLVCDLNSSFGFRTCRRGYSASSTADESANRFLFRNRGSKGNKGTDPTLFSFGSREVVIIACGRENHEQCHLLVTTQTQQSS